MLSSPLLCLWMLLQNMGLGVLGVGHADCKRLIYKLFLHPPSYCLSFYLCHCSPAPSTPGNSGKVVFAIKSSGFVKV